MRGTWRLASLHSWNTFATKWESSLLKSVSQRVLIQPKCQRMVKLNVFIVQLLR